MNSFWELFFFAHTGTFRNCLCLFQSRPLELSFHLRVLFCFLLACFSEGPPLGAAQRASLVRRSELVGRKLVLRENHCKQLRLMKKKLKYDYTYKPYKPGYKPLYKLL